MILYLLSNLLLVQIEFIFNVRTHFKRIKNNYVNTQ